MNHSKIYQEIQVETQIVQTMIRLPLFKQSDQSLCCSLSLIHVNIWPYFYSHHGILQTDIQRQPLLPAENTGRNQYGIIRIFSKLSRQPLQTSITSTFLTINQLESCSLSIILNNISLTDNHAQRNKPVVIINLKFSGSFTFLFYNIFCQPTCSTHLCSVMRLRRKRTISK